MARLPNLEKDQLKPEDLQFYESIADSRGSVRGPYGVLLHSPDLAARVAHTGTYVRFNLDLPESLKETIIITAAREIRSQYEFAAHARLARQAVQLGYAETVGISALILGFLGDLVTGGVSPRSVGSIVTIGAASGHAAQLGMETFLSFMALFSVNLAILNLLPIPVLDGGHLLFLGIEAVRGKALSVEQRLRWSHFGFLIIMGIMLWALSNDILRLFGI